MDGGRFSLPSMVSRSLFALALLILLGASLPLAAQPATGTLEGTVRAADGTPLPGATVRLPETGAGVVTNSSGQFVLRRVPAGTVRAVAEFVGYEPQTVDLVVRPGETVRVAFALVERPVVLDGLVVTAQRRVQEVQQIPVTVTAYEGEFLERIGVQEFDALSAFVPGLEIQIQSVNNPGFVIRGITSDSGDSRIEPRVSVFQDGVSISKSRGSVVELFDLERVEVLKGPQGTLFGRAAQIGAVHVIQNKPRNATEATVGVGTGNFGEVWTTATVNAPVVSNRLLARFAGLYNRRDGFVENQLGGTLNGKETLALRPSVRWLPTNQTVVDLIVNWQRDTPPGTAFKSGTYAPPGGDLSPFTAAALGRDPVLDEDEVFIDRTVWGATLLVDQGLGGPLRLDAITAYRRFDSLERFDADGTPAPALQFDEDAHGQQFSQEVRLTYDGTGRLSGFAGASLFWERGYQRVPFRTDERSFFVLLTPLLAQAGVPGITPLPLLNPQTGEPVLVPAIPNPANPSQLIPLKDRHEEGYTNFGRTTALEAFVDGTFRLTDRLSATAGLRGTLEFVTAAYEVQNSETPGRLGFILGVSPNNLFAPTNGRREARDRFASAVGRLALDYRAAPEANLFASVARGRRPNVINVSARDVTVLSDEIVWSYEAGLKGLTLADRLEYGLSLFYYDYSNFQTNVTLLEPQPDGTTRLVIEARDAGEATAYGLEAAVRAAVSRQLALFANYGFIDAAFDETDSEGNPQELAGNRFRLTPMHSVSAGLDLGVPVPGVGRAFLRPTYTWKSKVYFEEDNDEATSQDAYGLLNVRAGLDLPVQRLQLELYVRNLLDTQYLIDAGNTGGAFGIPTYIPGPPRLFGFRVTGRF